MKRLGARSQELILKTVEEIKAAIEAAVPGAGVEFVPNPSPSAQHSLRLAPATAVAERVTSLDTVLNLIAAEIQSVMEENDDKVPAPVVQKNLNSSTIDDVDEMLES